MSSLSGVVLNIFMQKTEDNKLFGKIGFQTMGPKTDKIVLRNMTTIEGWLNDGILKNLENEVVDDNATIMLYCRVSRPKSADDLPQVTGFVDADGNVVPVEPTAPAESDNEDDDIPF